MKSEKFCSYCKTFKPASDFYRRRLGTDVSPYCEICTNEEAIGRQSRLKQRAIAYKGGKCQICGYDRYNGALEFHHVDKSKKLEGIGKFRCASFDKVKSELDKTILICSNCHRELEAGLVSIDDTDK